MSVLALYVYIDICQRYSKDYSIRDPHSKTSTRHQTVNIGDLTRKHHKLHKAKYNILQRVYQHA